ncbi:hypothetical protein WCLP8_3360005 [uncultured Gammaproteobacteria bacterium]
MTNVTTYRDEMIQITVSQIEIGGASYPLQGITAVERRGGTLMEEKIFFYIIQFFVVAVIAIGIFAGFYIYSLLGVLLTAMIVMILNQSCQLILVNDRGRHVVLRHKDVKYIILLKGKIEQAIEACRELHPPDPRRGLCPGPTS